MEGIIATLYKYVPSSEITRDFVISFTFWNVLNLVVMNLNLPDKHLKRADFLDMRNRIVSFFHGLITMFLAGYHMYFLHSECGQTNTPFEALIIANSGGYFLYDLLAMAYFGLLDKGMLLHHTMCVVGTIIALIEGISANYIVAALFVAEISNPAMHFRMVTKHLGRRYTKAYEISELTYIRKQFY
jgi:hypothetical protein